MAFLKDLRRRSRASFRTADSSKDSSNTSNSVPSQKSTSTLNSAYQSSTPPSSHPATLSSSNLSVSKSNVQQQQQQQPPPLVPPRPVTGLNSNRNSMVSWLNHPTSSCDINLDCRDCHRPARRAPCAFLNPLLPLHPR